MIGEEETLILIRNKMTIANTNLYRIQGGKNFKSYEINDESNGLITITVCLIAKIPSKKLVEHMT